MSGSKSSVWAVAAVLLIVAAGSGTGRGESLWELASKNKELLRISTLFTAQNVRDYLSGDNGRVNAMDWCRENGVTHVFIETFRDGYTADRRTLRMAKGRFEEEGFDVSACVTTTRVGKVSTGWNVISCYTDQPTQERLQEIFEYTASIFDEIMIDDFLFTDCECEQCKRGRGAQSWAEYRCSLMRRLSNERILEPARAANADVKVIIKYPQWYDNFQNRGYEVVGQTADFDRIWVGTETRDFDNPRWGGKVQYEAYYIMRWLGEIGGAKTGGGWFDPYGTTEDTYVEQARQTVLADAKEMLLFCYGSLLRETGPANVAKLRAELPGLFELAAMVRGESIRGIAAPKPPNSDAGDEQYVYDFVGMLGLPLVPTASFATDAKAAFLPVHAYKDPGLSGKLKAMLAAKKPVIVTDGLAKRLGGLDLEDENLITLMVGGNPRGLLAVDQAEVRRIRRKMLAPFGFMFDGPVMVGLYLIGENLVVVENFSDETVFGSLKWPEPVKARQRLVLPPKANVEISFGLHSVEFRELAPRTLVVIEYE
ncbi:MAG: hypothetical protein JSU94_13520 [Phycisphaerales bacterium]|nr:MAG: hypothetical protein JSU94_13520 [Phycisphaerales bacterium]